MRHCFQMFLLIRIAQSLCYQGIAAGGTLRRGLELRFSRVFKRMIVRLISWAPASWVFKSALWMIIHDWIGLTRRYMALNWSAKKWSTPVRPLIGLFLAKIKQKWSVSSWIYHFYAYSRQINKKYALTGHTDPSPSPPRAAWGRGIKGEGVKNRSL